VKFKINDSAAFALGRLRASGYEAYIVGGSVRDMYLSRSVSDYDITTSAFPDEVKAVFSDERTVDTGIKHGTVTLVKDGENIEITSYRCESGYSDARHPDSVTFTRSLTEDLSRRDFTVNALAYDGEDTVVDLFSGKEDIKNRIIRAIGDPYERFSEDALRILRAVRFSSVLGFKIEKSTRDAMIGCKHLLSRISKERIAVEINKFLLGKNVKNALLENWEILAEIIPEIALMQGFDQKNKHHVYDILTHTAVTVENIEPTVQLRLAALLHDTGKPATCSTDGEGSHHFYGHPRESERIAERYLTEYKYDNFTKERVLLLVKVHDTVIDENKIYIKKRLRRMGKEAFFDLLKLKRADNSAQSPEYLRREHFDRIESLTNEILGEEQCFSLKNLAVNGNDLIKLGVPNGKMIGEILGVLLDSVIEERAENKKDVLLDIAKKYLEDKDEIRK